MFLLKTCHNLCCSVQAFKSEIQHPKMTAHIESIFLPATFKVCGKRIQRIPCTIKKMGKKYKHDKMGKKKVETQQNGQKHDKMGKKGTTTQVAHQKNFRGDNAVVVSVSVPHVFIAG